MPDPTLVATIRAKGKLFSAWESIQVKRNFGDFVSVFEFAAAEGAYGTSYSGLDLLPGDPVEIWLAGIKVVTGAVVIRSAAYDATSHQVVISGKSLPMEITVSSVVVKPGNFNGSTFQQAANAVLEPHGIKLSLVNPPPIASKPFANLAVQYGELGAEFITRMANMRGLILMDDADGNLVAGQLNSSSAPVAELYEGRNILRATGKLDDETAVGKWSTAVQSPGSDTNWPPRANSASVTDPDSLHPNRTKLFIAEHPGDSEDLAQRAQYEMMTDTTIISCSITVVGWLAPDGSLWQPNRMISVYSPMLFPTATGKVNLAIQGCTYSQDSAGGTTTVLDLVMPQNLTKAPAAGIPDIPGTGMPNTAKPDPPDYSIGT